MNKELVKHSIEWAIAQGFIKGAQIAATVWRTGISVNLLEDRDKAVKEIMSNAIIQDTMTLIELSQRPIETLSEEKGEEHD